MKKLSRLPLLVLGLFSLSSCALPPREAWRVIRHDGLLPYIAVEMGRKPVPKYVHLPTVRGPRFVTLTPSAKAPGPVARGGDVYVVRPLCLLPPNRFLAFRDSAAPQPLRVAVAPKPAARPVPAAHAQPRRMAAVAPATVNSGLILFGIKAARVLGRSL